MVNDQDRFERYVERLIQELDTRRRANRTTPELFVLVDRWERLAAMYDYGSEVDRQLQTLLRDGPSVGIRTVAAGNETLLSVRVSGMFRDRLTMRLSDPSRYHEAGIDPRRIPEELPPGRGFVGDQADEAQIAVVDDAVFAAERWTAATAPQVAPIRVDPLPESITIEAARALPTVGADSGLTVAAGVGGASLGVVRIPLEGGFVVAGRRGSGKSTALVWITEELLDDDVEVVIVHGSHRSPLQAMAGRPGVLGVFDSSASGEDLATALESTTGRVVIVVDDAAALARRSSGPGSLLGVAKAFVDARGPDQSGVVVSGDLDDLVANPRDAVAIALNSATGIVFSPTGLDLRSLDVRQAPERMTQPMNPGRAVLVDRGSVRLVQVPDDSTR